MKNEHAYDMYTELSRIFWHSARNVEFPQGMMSGISQGILKPSQGMLKPPQGMLRLRKGWQEFARDVEKLDVDAPIAGA